jgi:hypothetical protein
MNPSIIPFIPSTPSYTSPSQRSNRSINALNSSIGEGNNAEYDSSIPEQHSRGDNHNNNHNKVQQLPGLPHPSVTSPLNSSSHQTRASAGSIGNGSTNNHNNNNNNNNSLNKALSPKHVRAAKVAVTPSKNKIMSHSPNCGLDDEEEEVCLICQLALWPDQYYGYVEQWTEVPNRPQKKLVVRQANLGGSGGHHGQFGVHDVYGGNRDGNGYNNGNNNHNNNNNNNNSGEYFSQRSGGNNVGSNFDNNQQNNQQNNISELLSPHGLNKTGGILPQQPLSSTSGFHAAQVQGIDGPSNGLNSVSGNGYNHKNNQNSPIIPPQDQQKTSYGGHIQHPQKNQFLFPTLPATLLHSQPTQEIIEITEIPEIGPYEVISVCAANGHAKIHSACCEQWLWHCAEQQIHVKCSICRLSVPLQIDIVSNVSKALPKIQQMRSVVTTNNLNILYKP